MFRYWLSGSVNAASRAHRLHSSDGTFTNDLLSAWGWVCNTNKKFAKKKTEMRSNLFRVTFKGIWWWWCRWNLCSSLIVGWIHPWVLWRGAWINQMLIENCLLAPLPLGDHADCLPTTYKISVEKHLRVQWSFQHEPKLFSIMHKSCNQHQMIWYYTCMYWFPVCQICLFQW